MAQANTWRRVLVLLRARARQPLHATLLALPLACSSGEAAPTAEAVPDYASVQVHVARAAAAGAAVGAPADIASACEHAHEHEHAAPVAGPEPMHDVNAPVQPGPVLAPPPATEGPILNADIHRQRRSAELRVLGRDAAPGPHAPSYARADAPPSPARSRVPPLAHFVPVDGEASLAHFHHALGALAAGLDDDGKVRVLVYGASHTQADLYPSYLRAYLQGRFGNGGQGFVLFGRVNRWHRTLDAPARHRAFAVHRSRYRTDKQVEPLGLFGAALVGQNSDAFAEVVTAKDSLNTEFEVHYFKQPGGGDFSLQLDGQVVARIPTGADAPGAASYIFKASEGRHRIRARLHGNGPVRLFGIIAETASPGVVVDTLGIGGAQMSDNLYWQEDVWLDAVRHRKPDLVTFAYGTNEALDTGRSIASYESQVRAVLARLRKAAPDVSCVFITPFDLPKHVRPRLLQLIESQRRISAEFGCGLWDGYAFMGGEGSIQRWARARPPLASSDHVHLTPRGYVYAGMAIGDALMRAYDLDPAQWASSMTLVSAPSLP